MLKFELASTDAHSKARAGKVTTDHGSFETPIFMPVGTIGTVKGVHQHELVNDIKAQIILGNTYHLFLRPGIEILEKAGGLHKFMNWDRPMLTDSGGYQVYSLGEIRKIKPEGVTFRSHIDGRKLFFSPEIAIDIQRSIGGDIIMAFDECTPYPCDYNYAKKSLKLTHKWLQRCCDHFDNTQAKYDYQQTMIPIVQGSTYTDLRKDSARVIADFDRPANAIGGLSVGEPAPEMYAMTDVVCNELPWEKPRYLMGVGTPMNILECIALGIDMFDCVLPSRNARHGLLYTSEGMINIKNAKWKDCFDPIDANATTEVSRVHTKAYLRHLFQCKELLAGQIATIHNLGFYLWLVTTAREKIIAGTFHAWKTTMVQNMSRRL